MENSKIVLAGGNGYLGRLLSQHFAARNHEVVILTRRPLEDQSSVRHVHWDGATPGAWMAELENAGAVINLAGRSVNCRYHARNREMIRNSRTVSTAVLGRAIASCVHPPKAWLNSSSATIYRHAEDREMDEFTGEIGSGFSVDVVQQWEAVLDAAKTPCTRKVALRSAMVLGPGADGVFGAFHRLARLGLGGTLGGGGQFVSWIHHRDFILAIEHILQQEHLSGPINLTSPNPISNREFMRILREADHRKIGLPATAWMLEIGAFFLRTETELLLKSRRVIPGKLLREGFIFDYPHWQGAVRELLHHPLHPLLEDHFEKLHAPLHTH